MNQINTQNDSLNSQQQELMLDEVRQAVNDMAQLVSVHTSVDSLPVIDIADESSSEKTPSIRGEESEFNDDEEEYTKALLLEIEDAQSIEDLEDIYKRFSSRAGKLRENVLATKKQEVILAYLNLMTTLNMLRSQINTIKSSNITAINAKQISAEISAKLNASRSILLESARKAAFNNGLLQSLKVVETAIKSQLSLQARLQPNELSLQSQRLSKLLEQLQKAQKAIEQGRLTDEQAKKISDVLSKNLVTVQSEQAQRLSALRQQLTNAQNIAALKPQISAQILVAERLNAALLQATVRVSQLQTWLEATRANANKVQADISVNRVTQQQTTRILQKQISSQNAAHLANVSQVNNLARISNDTVKTITQPQTNTSVTKPEIAQKANDTVTNKQPLETRQQALQSPVPDTVKSAQSLQEALKTAQAQTPLQVQPQPQAQPQEVAKQAIQTPATPELVSLKPEVIKSPEVVKSPVELKPEVKNPELKEPPKPEIKDPCKGCSGGKGCCALPKFEELVKSVQNQKETSVEIGREVTHSFSKIAESVRDSEITQQRTEATVQNAKLAEQLLQHKANEPTTQAESAFKPATIVTAQNLVPPPPPPSISQGM